MSSLDSSSANLTWQKCYQNSFRSSADLFEFLNISNPQKINYSTLIPKAFASKIKEQGPESAIWKQFVPSTAENSDIGLYDPIGDMKHNKAPGIIHRYKSRILFTPTNICPVSCRYCFRKNELENNDEIFRTNLDELENYLSQHPEVNEVILTGGDPLILSNQKIEKIFNLLLLKKILFVRFHTRTPIILPKRIDDDFLSLLERYQFQFKKILLVLHTNHVSEIDDEVKRALLKLKFLHIEKLTQSVLLNQINDSEEDLITLFYKILDVGFKPYYLHHPDQVKGGMHFYLSLERGRAIYSKLRDQMPGWAIPHYVIDPSGGHGKQLAYNPEGLSFNGQLLDRFNNLNNYHPLTLDN